MKSDRRRYFLACSILLTLTGIFAGCSSANQSKVSGFNNSEQDKQMKEFSIENYQKTFRDDRTSVSKYSKRYENEIETIKKTGYSNFNFENSEFINFPNVKKLEVFTGESHGISVQESWDTIENWLKDIGKQNVIDMKQEVRIVSPQLGLDENDEYFLFYDHMSEFDSGAGAFINNKQCHIQIAADGIYSMSDGKITEYLGVDAKAGLDAQQLYTEDVVETGSLSELGDRRYELLDGKLSVQEGAQMVKDYFLAGTPFPCEEGVSIEIRQVNIFKLGNLYGYDYALRRTYHSIPLAYMDYGFYQSSQEYQVDGDIKHAYVVDSSGVSAFCGYNEAEKLIVLAADDKIMGIESTVNHISEEFGSMLDVQVESVEFVYLPVHFNSFEDSEKMIAFPCWQIEGCNQIKNEYIRIYTDVFTGDIYYYTINLEE